MILKYKSNAVNAYLKPIRKQIVDLVKEGSEVLDLGCGDGDLLFKLSPHINYGLGIDNAEHLINHGRQRVERFGIGNLNFKQANLLEDLQVQAKFDVAVCSLLLHCIPFLDAIDLINR